MLTSRDVGTLGRVYFPWGAGGRIDELSSDVVDYFDHGIVVRPDDVVVDCGANIGMFALIAAEPISRMMD